MELSSVSSLGKRPSLIFICSLTLVLIPFLSFTSSQSTQANVCSSRFEAALAPECFEAFNVNFSGVVHVLSGNRSGEIPANYNFSSFLKFMCSVPMQDEIVPCVLKQMQKYNGSSCTDEDRVGVLGRGGQLLAFMDSFCGESCEQEATQSLIQCYAAVNVDAEPILSQNASIADNKYSVVGTNESEFDNYCANRQKLFSCLSPLGNTCPGLIERLYTIGIDLEAMESATGVLCDDKEKYFKGLTCFTKPWPGIAQCRQVTESNMQQVLAGRYQTGDIKPSLYMDKLCEAKLTQVDCELQYFEETCDEDSSSLRTAVECTILPKPCRENQQFSPIYDGICKATTTPPPPVTVRPTKPTGPPGGGPGAGGDGSGAPSMVVPPLVLLCFLSLHRLLWH